jgi:hypothetical protein
MTALQWWLFGEACYFAAVAGALWQVTINGSVHW